MFKFEFDMGKSFINLECNKLLMKPQGLSNKHIKKYSSIAENKCFIDANDSRINDQILIDCLLRNFPVMMTSRRNQKFLINVIFIRLLISIRTFIRFKSVQHPLI